MSVLLADVAHGRSNNFNLIRVLAASGVIFSHAYPLTMGPTAAEPLQYWLHGANLGRFSVLVFFATSGFFITASYVNSRSTVDFILARVLRIFPALFIMAILVYSAIGLIHAGGLDYWRHVPLLIAETVTMIRGLHGSYVVPFFSGNPFPNEINGSLWTLRYELLCYFGVLAAGNVGLFRSKIVLFAVVVIFAIFSVVAPFITDIFAVLRLSEVGLPFAFGTAAFLLRDHIRLDWRIAMVLLAIAIGLHPTPLFFVGLNLTIVYWVLWLGYGQFPAVDHYRRLGDYSYGIYIYAFPIQQFMAKIGVLTPLANAFSSLAVTVVVAILSWHFVEKPALSLRRRWAPAAASRFAPGPEVK